MGETTNNKAEISREEAADLVQELARELRSEGPSEIHVGNKMLTLSPAPEVEYEIEVEERSPMLGGPREKVTVSVGWEVGDEEP